MRSLFHLFALSALHIGCTSGLWGPFAEDTKWNCNITPCTGTQTCNTATGLCEGGGGDMGTDDPDMPTPIFIKEETVLTISGRSFYHLAVADLVDDSSPEIFLSGDSIGGNQDAVLLSKGTSYMMPAPVTGIPGSQFITSIAAYRYGEQPQDVVAATLNINSPMDTNGTLLHFYKNNTSLAIKTTNLTLVGYKAVAAGYVPSDQIPDIVITSSMAPIAEGVYPGNGANGDAAIFTGQAAAVPRANFNGPSMVPRKPYSFVTLLTKPPSAGWTNSTAFVGAATKPTSSTSVELLADGNGVLFQNIPATRATDLALIADMDNSGTYDLVFVALRPLPPVSTVRVSFNAGTNMAPQFGMPMSMLDDQTGNVASTSGVNLVDFDGDGFTDIVLALYEKKAFYFWRNVSDGAGGRTFKAFRLLQGSVGARSVSLDHMDSDSCKDLVALFGGDSSNQGTEVQILHGRCR